ncbi:MAG: hypothetical protein JWP13_46, partial [Candidatus Saccharibacteria bacterium]|nr:hypothetical protein [Candidatus Saccharibacteria bacterium]
LYIIANNTTIVNIRKSWLTPNNDKAPMPEIASELVLNT